jgi:chorismate synthase
MMVGTLEKFPAGIKVDKKSIDIELKNRQMGYGRGKRMSIEKDSVEIISGVWKGISTGAPLSFIIKNLAGNTEKEERYSPRPGHGDYSAFKKYKLEDLNIYAERNSARWTSVMTVLGQLAKQFLNHLKIDSTSYVYSLGRVIDENKYDFEYIKNNKITETATPNEEYSELFKKEIDNFSKNSLGGKIRVIAKNIKPGIGDYSNLFEKIDSKIGKYFFAIPSVKGVVIGSENFHVPGTNYNDEFFVENDEISRKSNSAGGIEAGFTNGENILVNIYAKPIPTVLEPMDSVDLKNNKNTKTKYIRSDITAVPALSIILENVMNLMLFEAIIENFGTGNYKDIVKRYQEF